MTNRSCGASGAAGQQDSDAAAAPPEQGTPARARRVRSADLFAGDSSELEIEHNGDIYCLRRTSKGKLILTK
jgi:hemin uptake protein HemP